MPYNGSGSFTVDSSYFPAVAGALIESAKYNGALNDIATGLSNAVTKDGQQTITANLPMSGFRHTGVGNAATRTDYAALGQVQDSSALWAGTAGGTADAITLTLTPAISAYAAGQSFTYKSGASANTTAMTVSVSGLTTKAIQKNGVALTSGDHPANMWFRITYDGAAFQLEQISSLASPAFTGTPTAPTAALDTNTTQLATTAFVLNQAGDSLPLVEAATAAAGTDESYARADHVHPQRNLPLSTVATTSGTSVSISTVVPSWARRITLIFLGVSTNGTSGMGIQIGTSSGLETTLYNGESSTLTTVVASSSWSNGFLIRTVAASAACSGIMTLHLVDGANNKWVSMHTLRSAPSTVVTGAGDKELSGTLTRVSLISTDTFDAGAVGISWE